MPHFFPPVPCRFLRLRAKNRHRPIVSLLTLDFPPEDSHALYSFWLLNSSVTCPLTADWWSICLPRLGVCLCTFRLAFTPAATASPSARDKGDTESLDCTSVPTWPRLVSGIIATSKVRQVAGSWVVSGHCSSRWRVPFKSQGDVGLDA